MERVRGEHPPTDAGWRHDALTGSRHSRLLDDLHEPLEDQDPERAADVCAEICRDALGDFAPALLLLPAAERRRARALAAFSLTLFDFARQRGLEGDRLAQINRWEFALDQALDGAPPGQPVFVLMSAEERRKPWRRESLDRLFAHARSAATGREPDPTSAGRELANSFAEALLDREVPPETGGLGAALIRLTTLQGEPPASGDELDRIGALLESAPGALPAPWGRATRYLQLAARSVLGAINKGARKSSLRIPIRLAFLLRARFF